MQPPRLTRRGHPDEHLVEAEEIQGVARRHQRLLGSDQAHDLVSGGSREGRQRRVQPGLRPADANTRVASTPGAGTAITRTCPHGNQDGEGAGVPVGKSRNRRLEQARVGRLLGHDQYLTNTHAFTDCNCTEILPAACPKPISLKSVSVAAAQSQSDSTA
jgi:hypothetical protein